MKSGCTRSEGKFFRIPRFGFLFAAASLTACGPASDMVTVKLVSGLEKSPAQTNLMTTLASGPAQTTLTPINGLFPCIQNNVRVGYNNPTTRQVVGFPVQAQTLIQIPQANPPVFGTAIQSVAFPEIRLQVPRNTPLDIGIVGAITTGAADSNGVCKSLDGDPNDTTVPSINSSYPLFGSTEFPNGLSSEAVIPVRVWGTLSSAETVASVCIDGDCARDRFVQVALPTVSNVNNTVNSLRIQYFEGTGAQFGIFLNLVSAHFIPKSGPIRAQLHNGNSDWTPCVYQDSQLIPIDEISENGINASCGSLMITFSRLQPR